MLDTPGGFDSHRHPVVLFSPVRTQVQKVEHLCKGTGWSGTRPGEGRAAPLSHMAQGGRALPRRSQSPGGRLLNCVLEPSPFLAMVRNDSPVTSSMGICERALTSAVTSLCSEQMRTPSSTSPWRSTWRT